MTGPPAAIFPAVAAHVRTYHKRVIYEEQNGRLRVMEEGYRFVCQTVAA
jgi:hypothetical protein